MVIGSSGDNPLPIPRPVSRSTYVYGLCDRPQFVALGGGQVQRQFPIAAKRDRDAASVGGNGGRIQ
jgi:hypothetical protein